jgi:signal transduction histidine kinase
VAGCVDRERELLPEETRHQLLLRQPAGPITVSVERARIDQVLINLIENAVKYSPEGGVITITTQVVGSAVQVSVADQGIGIPRLELPQVFSAFFRASNASARNYNGLGLGLHLSKAVVDAHGGDLTLSSQEGHGTTATLTLPLSDPE